MPTEIELRFRLRADLLTRLGRHPALTRAIAAPKVTSHLRATYYDTEKHELSAHRLGLRVRREGGRYIQTAKRDTDESAARGERDEWSCVLPTPVPDLRRLRARPLAEAMNGAVSKALLPVFGTDVRRTTWRVRGNNGALIEVALDRGQLVAGKRTQAIHEAEFELKKGGPAGLYAFALAVHREAVPLVLEPESKAARGYALATERAPAPHYAQDVPLAPPMTAEEACKTVFRNCLDQILGSQAAAADGTDPEGVHQVRVGIRRFRAALNVFKDFLPGARRREVSDELRWLAQELGPAREWDVLIGDTIAPALAAAPDDALLARILDSARAQQVAAYRKLRRAFASPRHTDLMLAVMLWLAEDWRASGKGGRAKRLGQPIAIHAWRVLQRADHRLRGLAERVADLEPDERHAIRIAAKKARYAAEFLAALAPPRAIAPYVKALKKVQEEFGRANDQTRAEALLASLDIGGEAPSRDLIARLIHQGGGDARPRLKGAWAGYQRTMPIHVALGHKA